MGSLYSYYFVQLFYNMGCHTGQFVDGNYKGSTFSSVI